MHNLNSILWDLFTDFENCTMNFFFFSPGLLKPPQERRMQLITNHFSCPFLPVRCSDFWMHSSGGSEQQSFHKQSHPSRPCSKQNNKTMIPVDRWSDRTVTLNQPCGLPHNLVENFLSVFASLPSQTRGKTIASGFTVKIVSPQCTLFWSLFAWEGLCWGTMHSEKLWKLNMNELLMHLT